MRYLHLIFLGLAAQVLGWTLAPRRWRYFLGVAALALDAAWVFWRITDHRSLTVAGLWSLSPIATWLTFHILLVPLLVLEGAARVVARWRWWVRLPGLILIVGGLGWGLAEAYGPPVVTEVALAYPDLPPAFEGYRIILVGDIHAGEYIGTRTLGRWARAVQGLQGDVLVAAGDFISNRAEEAERPGVAFEGVTPPDGKIGILGNHDVYPRNQEVAQRLRRHGWVMLVDQACAVERGGQRLVFLGVTYPRHEPVAEIRPAWKDQPWPQGFRIGICHSPVQWPGLLEAGARLTLAAHTHGGQVNLSPFYNAADEISPYVAGLFQQGASSLFVTRGLGLTSLPLRFRCRPEIVRITLHRS